ncbi:MAG: polymer-forming cytoskeletal protein [Acidobacteria bacterium]|nr:polymer-forming cytoskeletal protein [Acidobacteriota bacterium]
MFRPGKPKDEPEPHQPQAQQQPAPAPQAANEDTQQRYRASEQTSSTGVRGSMNDGQANSGKAYTESDALARDIKEGTLTGFVGNGTNMTGEANFKGMLRVDGHLSGRVSSQDGTLIVSTGGQVDANVEVSVAQIYGTVNGDVVATKRIELGRVAKVTGNFGRRRHLRRAEDRHAQRFDRVFVDGRRLFSGRRFFGRGRVLGRNLFVRRRDFFEPRRAEALRRVQLA